MGIPPKAKRVFHGVLHDVYQWKQKLFDGSSSTFEMIVRQPSTEIIATIGNKIIILEQQQPGRKAYPSLPGGEWNLAILPYTLPGGNCWRKQDIQRRNGFY